MKNLKLIIILTVVSVSALYSQSRDYRVHSRSMLHQTVYNTGEVGRSYDAGGSGIPGGYPPSMEWPPNGHAYIDRKEYEGQHTSMGGGVYIALTKNDTMRQYAFCGAISSDKGNTTPVEGVYSNPISIERRENFPVLANGALNLAYNPDEAEEIIFSKWSTPNTGITVSRTSRAWSFPGYDGFIIYEYEFKNTTTDTLKDISFAWTYGLAPSMFAFERKYNRWSEADFRSNSTFARFDFRRYLSYNHDRDGRPDTVLFDTWSKEGDRGGLNAPQAVGYMILHYDYDHLATKGHTKQTISTDEAKVVWDANNKIKQPFLNRYENGNLYFGKVIGWFDLGTRKTGSFKAGDTLYMPYDNNYWIGRVKPSHKLAYTQPVAHGYGFGPYILGPGEVAKFTVAEVVGYGPGRATDSVYKDIGGCPIATDQVNVNPVPSWYKTITYPDIQGSTIGSNYLSNHPLPWYVNPEVVSIRDMADRAIQMYIGGQVIKYDSLQFKPEYTATTGIYKVPIPFPAPVIRVENTSSASNKIVWGPQVESFTTPRLNAPFSHYLVMRALHPLGPWALIDSVGKRDIRYFQDSVYVVKDLLSDLGVDVYYAVYSVDALGKKSGFTNMTSHTTQAPAAPVLEKVYVVPNPLIVTNGRSGSAQGGDVSDQIGFFGLTKKCTIRIFSFSGQLVQTIDHDSDAYSNVSWFQISRNHQMIASGVYFFTVEDAATGKRAKGKFVIIH